MLRFHDYLMVDALSFAEHLCKPKTPRGEHNMQIGKLQLMSATCSYFVSAHLVLATITVIIEGSETAMRCDFTRRTRILQC